MSKEILLASSAIGTLIAAGFVGKAFVLPIAAAAIAQGDILFTVAGEGKAKAIGRSADAFGTVPLDHFVMSWKGHHLNDPRFLTTPGKDHLYVGSSPAWEVLDNDPNIDPEEYEIRSKFSRNIGAYYVGLPVMRNVYVYKFKWSEIKVSDKEGDDKGTDDIWSREEWTNFIFLKPIPYAIIVDKVLTLDLIPVRALITVTVRVNNPNLALFGTGSWFQQVSAAVDRVARDYIGVHTYYQLKSESDEPLTQEQIEAMQKGAAAAGITAQAGALSTHTSEDRKDLFSSKIIKLTDVVLDEKDPNKPKGLKGTFGVSIDVVDLRWVRREGDTDHKIADAQSLPWIAQQEKTAAITKAEGQAKSMELLGAAEANALEYRLKVLSRYDQGALLAQLDAIVASSKGPGNMLLWANNPLLQQRFPGLGELLDSSGINTPEALRQFMAERGIAKTAAAAPAPSEPQSGATT